MILNHSSANSNSYSSLWQLIQSSNSSASNTLFLVLRWQAIFVPRFMCTTNQRSRTPHLTPMPASSFVSSAMPPGRSLTVTMNRHRRPSAANPRSRHLPSTVVSMLPPQSGTTTLQKETCLGHAFFLVLLDNDSLRVVCLSMHNDPMLGNIPRHQHTYGRSTVIN